MSITLSQSLNSSSTVVSVKRSTVRTFSDNLGNLYFVGATTSLDEDNNLKIYGFQKPQNDDGNLYLKIRRKKMANQFLAGVGKALLFYDSQLIGVAKTLTESTFNFSISSEDVRGGQANGLRGKYFHDSNLSVNLVDAMFNMEYVAANLGVDIESGGLSLYESSSSGETVASGGTISLSNTAVAFDGSILAWYKLPGATSWNVGTVSNNTLTISGASEGDVYCIKYFYQNEDARQLTISADYVPRVLHLVIISDLFSGDTSNISSATKYGRIITDIPSFQLEGNMDLNLTATSAATVSLMGNALAVDASDSCEEDPYYGTMTEEIFDTSWKDSVIALAIENSDVELSNSETETLLVRAVYGGLMASNRIDNSEITFVVESGSSATVGANTGIVTADASTTGETIISATLTDYDDIVAYATITVS